MASRMEVLGQTAGIAHEKKCFPRSKGSSIRKLGVRVIFEHRKAISNNVLAII